MRLTVVLTACAVAGCAGLKANYAPPTSGPMAIVEVGESEGIINRRVIVHGPDICRVEQAKLVGLVKSKTIGIEYVETYTIVVPAGKPVAISMPWYSATPGGGKVEFTYCQPAAVFTPEVGRRYKLEFASCSATLSDDRGASRPARIFTDCDIGPSSEPTEWMFYLKPKKQ